MRYRELTHVVILACAGLALSGPVAAAGPVVTIRVEGVKAAEGFLLVALHDEQAWSAEPLVAAKIAVSGETTILTLIAPSPGRYGVKLFHDVNGDGALGRNIVGFPVEPFGFSNNAPILLGPPAFASAAFDVGPSGALQTITLK